MCRGAIRALDRVRAGLILIVVDLVLGVVGGCNRDLGHRRVTILYLLDLQVVGPVVLVLGYPMPTHRSACSDIGMARLT